MKRTLLIVCLIGCGRILLGFPDQGLSSRDLPERTERADTTETDDIPTPTHCAALSAAIESQERIIEEAEATIRDLEFAEQLLDCPPPAEPAR